MKYFAYFDTLILTLMTALLTLPIAIYKLVPILIKLFIVLNPPSIYTHD